MSFTDVERAIKDAVDVTPPLVFQAKAYLVSHVSGYTGQMIDLFSAEMGGTFVQPVVIHPSADQDAVIRDVARWLSCQAAAREAVWGLIGSGVLIPRSGAMNEPELSVQWTTVVPGSGGTSSGWSFGKAIPVPDRVSLSVAGSTHLTDGDLFLHSLDVLDLDPQVSESLREAVTCFRHDLYVPAQVMLGRALEGCWTVLGEVLVAAAPGETAAQVFGKQLAKGLHLAQLPSRVTSLYTNVAYAGVAKSSGVSQSDLSTILLWTDTLRQSRNAVHHANNSTLGATWETTAALLMGAVPNIRALYAVIKAAETTARV
jgi:hypothetical protein